VPEANPEFSSALEWLRSTVLRRYGTEVAEKNCRAGQMSLRVEDHAIASRVAAALSSWITETGRHGWRVFSSGHSVDLLDANTSKINVVERMKSDLNIQNVEFLMIGDAGQIGGNDHELLRNTYSLSADKVSDSPTCCWNLVPPGVRQADATSFYLNSMSFSDQRVLLRLPLRAA